MTVGSIQVLRCTYPKRLRGYSRGARRLFQDVAHIFVRLLRTGRFILSLGAACSFGRLSLYRGVVFSVATPTGRTRHEVFAVSECDYITYSQQYDSFGKKKKKIVPLLTVRLLTGYTIFMPTPLNDSGYVSVSSVRAAVRACGRFFYLIAFCRPRRCNTFDSNGFHLGARANIRRNMGSCLGQAESAGSDDWPSTGGGVGVGGGDDEAQAAHRALLAGLHRWCLDVSDLGKLSSEQVCQAGPRLSLLISTAVPKCVAILFWLFWSVLFCFCKP